MAARRVISRFTREALDIAPDGKRFVVFPSFDVPHPEQLVDPHAVFLLNFFDDLKRRFR